MDRTVARFTTHAEQELETLRYWRGQDSAEKFKIVAELAQIFSSMNGIDIDAQGPKDLLFALNEHGVEYLVVGGQAVIAYGVPRLTKDLDVFIQSSLSNSEAVYRALADFGAPVRDFSPADFRDHPDAIFQFGVEPTRIDVLQSIGSLPFKHAWERRVDKRVDETLTVPFLSVQDLIENKLETGRLQDLADAERLQKILKVR